MSRDELIAAIKESPEWKKTYRRGRITVRNKPDGKLNGILPPKTFSVWLELEKTFECIWFFAAAELGVKPRKCEYRMLTADLVENWVERLDLVF